MRSLEELLARLPLIDAIRDCEIRQAWFADDATAAGSLTGLCKWWSALVSLGPAFGYNVKPSKSWLIVKAEHLDLAKNLFDGCGVGITVEGKRHLGAAIGSPTFIWHYVLGVVARGAGTLGKNKK